MTKRLHLLLIVIFLLYSSIAFAIQDVNCDTSNDRGNILCVYTGITAWPPFPSYTIRGDENPTTQEEQDAFGTGGFYTELYSYGVEISFGGGAMDWYGRSCNNPHVAGNCQGVDVTAASVSCMNGNGNIESTPFSGDPCPDDQCKFLVQKSTTFPRRTTKATCNFLPTTPVGNPVRKDYTVSYALSAYVYDAYNNRLVLRTFTDSKTYQLGCTNYQGCTEGRTCVSIGERTECWCIDQTGSCQECIKKANDRSCDCDAECMSGNCDGGICQAACQCTSGDCCDECNYFPSTQQPTGKTDTPITGEKRCISKDVYQNYTDWYCDGTSAEPKSRIVERYEKSCSEHCWGGVCKPYKLKILAIPVRWTRDDDAFKNAFREALNVFLEQLEIAKCNDTAVYIEWVGVSQNLSDFSCCFSQDCIDDKNECQVNRISEYAAQLRKNPKDFNVVAGFIDKNSVWDIHCTHGLARTDGCRSGNTVWAIEDEDYKHLMAHEIGHVFGLSEEYCSIIAGSTDENCNDGGWLYDGKDVNYLDAKQPYDCPPDGSNDSQGIKCCNFGRYNCARDSICCLGNKNSIGGRSTMSYTNAPGPKAFEGHSLAHLNIQNKLRCD